MSSRITFAIATIEMIRATLAAGIAVVSLSLGVRAQRHGGKALPLDNLGARTSRHRRARPRGVGAVLCTDLQVRAASAAGARHAALLRRARRPAGRSTGRLHRHRRGRRTAAGDRPLLRAGEGLRPRRASPARCRRRASASPRPGPTGMWPDPDRLELSCSSRRRVW